MKFPFSNSYKFRHSFEVCSAGDLVYVRNYKCASTFFYWNFAKKFNWAEIEFKDIDWDRQRVFGHLLDPIQRRHKGIAEFLHMTQTQHLLEDDKFCNLIKNAPALDTHSARYVDQFGEYAEKIDWIPLYLPQDEVITQTEKIMLSHGIRPLDRWDHYWVHRSDTAKKKTEHRVAELWNSTVSKEDWLGFYYEPDIDLYQRVLTQFNPRGSTWEDTTWLSQRPWFK